MISMYNKSKSAFCLLISVLSLVLVCGCSTTKPDAREDLVRSLKGANVDGYFFATSEDEVQIATSLTNSAGRNLIKLDSAATNLVLRYTSVKQKSTNATRTYKAEVTKAGSALTLLITDIASGEVITRTPFPAPEPHSKTDSSAAPPAFDTLEDCIRDFNCTRRSALQCEADRTCQNQFAGLICCLKNGQCISVHFVIKPTAFRCRFIDFVGDLEGLVLSQ